MDTYIAYFVNTGANKDSIRANSPKDAHALATAKFAGNKNYMLGVHVATNQVSFNKVDAARIDIWYGTEKIGCLRKPKLNRMWYLSTSRDLPKSILRAIDVKQNELYQAPAHT